jgi:hypothetical protein
MDQGRVVQYGRPWELLEASEGPFARLVEQTGPVSSQYLRAMARQHHHQQQQEQQQVDEQFGSSSTSSPPAEDMLS